MSNDSQKGIHFTFLLLVPFYQFIIDTMLEGCSRRVCTWLESRKRSPGAQSRRSLTPPCNSSRQSLPVSHCMKSPLHNIYCMSRLDRAMFFPLRQLAPAFTTLWHSHSQKITRRRYTFSKRSIFRRGKFRLFGHPRGLYWVHCSKIHSRRIVTVKVRRCSSKGTP